MINPSNSYEHSCMVATRDPPLASRPKSTSQEGGVWNPRKRPAPHRGYAVPEFEKWNENDSQSAAKCMDIFNRKPKEKSKAENYVPNNTAQPSPEPKKCCFPYFPFSQQRIQRLASHSAQSVSKNTTSSSSAKTVLSYPSTKSDLASAISYYGVRVFDYAELEAATNNFHPSTVQGVLPDGRKAAVKKVYNGFKHVEQFMHEVGIMAGLRHTNLVTLYGCASRNREHLLVYEYIPNGTVADHLHGEHTTSSLFSWPIRLSIAVETANALVYLHQRNIIHRDVKTENVLLDNDFHVKVADFGLMRLLPNNVAHLSTAPMGTPGYVDPEYHQCYQFSGKSDVYSFGVVLVELISSLPAVDICRYPSDINLSNMAVNKIRNGKLQELVDANLGFETDNNVRRMVTLVAELAFRCLQRGRDMRPSMEEVLRTLRQIQSDDLNGHKVDTATCHHALNPDVA